MKKAYNLCLLLVIYLFSSVMPEKEHSSTDKPALQTTQIPTDISMWASTTPAASWEATFGYGRIGYSTSSAGDVNGDGFDDIITGAPFLNNEKGAAFVYYGGAAGISGSWVHQFTDYSCYFGNSVSRAGDVNGDGFDDVIVGAYVYPGITPYLNRGKAFVFYGSATGLPSMPSWTDSTLQAASFYAQQVNAAGDVNGDGYDDVMVSAPQWDQSGVGGNVGKVYVYYGSATGLSTTASWTVVGDQAGCQLGYGMGSAGDVNKDGYDDVIVSASYYTNGQNSEGRMYLYYGSATGLATSPAWVTESNLQYGMLGRYRTVPVDVNGDSYVDLAVVTSEMGLMSFTSYIYVYYNGPGGLSTTPGWSISSIPAVGGFGDMASMGDMNNDGYEDIVVSQPVFNSQGRVCIYYGTPGGLSFVPGWTASYTDPNPWYGPRFGLTVANAGDIDNDGINDVLVGSTDVNNWGKIYLFRAPVLTIITLPLKLVSFASVCNGNEMQLQWQTADEQNSQQFIIERSDNSNNWEAVATLAATGGPKYTYNIPSSAAIGKYRLKMVDIDGSFTYSSVLSIRNACGENNFKWAVAPNPVRSSGRLQLDISNYSGSSTPLKVMLTDMNGKTIQLASANIPKSVAYHTSLDLPALAAGTYVISISNEKVNESKTIIIAK